MKGFFDTIPKELDESARVDGATAAQIFWGVILPLAAPVLVGRRADLVRLHAERVRPRLGALADERATSRLPVGMQGFISQQYGQRWGPFAAGVADGGRPGRRPLPVPAEVDRERPDRRRGQGMSASTRSVHSCSTSRITTARICTSLERPDELGGEAVVRLRVCRGRPAPTASLLRYERDGEPRGVEATSTRRPRPTSGGAPSSRSRTRSRATAGCSRAGAPATRG